jgi:glutathione S-transferase
MKLHMSPVSPSSLAVVHFAAEEAIPLERQLVDLRSGEHRQEAYLRLNPAGMVPILEDGDFHLTEASSILRYLAEKTGSKAYPADLQRRARVNERMDWVMSNFYPYWGPWLIYPQVLPHFKHTDGVQPSVLARGQERSKRWLTLLNDAWIGKRRYLCGDELTIADYLGFAVVSLADVVHADLSAFANVARWRETMRALPTTAATYQAVAGWSQTTAGSTYQFV